MHNLRSIRADFELHGEAVWERFNRGKKDQHWYYSSVVKALLLRKKECKLIGQLEKEVKSVFGSIELLTKKEIDVLFTCSYSIADSAIDDLEKYGIKQLTEDILREADRLYREDDEAIWLKLKDLSSKGVKFQNNSDGPLILAGFCIALQAKAGWTDEQLFSHFKRNEGKL